MKRFLSIFILSVFCTLTVFFQTNQSKLRSPASYTIIGRCNDQFALFLHSRSDIVTLSEHANFLVKELKKEHIEYYPYLLPKGRLGLMILPNDPYFGGSKLYDLFRKFEGYRFIYSDEPISGSQLPYRTEGKYVIFNKNYVEEYISQTNKGSLVERVRFSLPHFVETLVKKVAKDQFEGEIKVIEKSGQRLVRLTVTEHLGSGVFGTVHKVNVEAISQNAAREFPEFFTKDGLPRTDLVVKFAHEVSLPSPRQSNLWIHTLNKEIEQTNVMNSLINNPRVTSPIIYAEHGSHPFIIKEFIDAKSIQEMSKEQLSLTEDQIHSLKVDIFEKSKELLYSRNVGWDIRPENLAWDETTKTFRNYESGSLPAFLANRLYLQGGFDQYLEYFEKRMHFWRQQSK